MVNFSTQNIADIVETVGSKLAEYGYTGNTKISVEVDKPTFKKIDEDLYYRQFPDGKDFVPSEGEIIVTLGTLSLIVYELAPQADSSKESKT